MKKGQQEYWDKFVTIHRKETVMISESYLRGEMSRDELIESYDAMPIKNHSHRDAERLAEFLDKYFI